MFQSQKAFLNGKHTNAFDQLAQRALVVDAKLAALQINAYNLGNSEAHEACRRARNAAFIAFALAHKERRYGFATDIAAHIDAVSQGIVTETGLEQCGNLVGQAESAAQELQPLLPGVCQVSGGGVTILRGDHAVLAMRGTIPVNDNPNPAE
jgi:hypothetical protein